MQLLARAIPKMLSFPVLGKLTYKQLLAGSSVVKKSVNV
jgi:hypothetical protein